MSERNVLIDKLYAYADALESAAKNGPPFDYDAEMSPREFRKVAEILEEEINRLRGDLQFIADFKSEGEGDEVAYLQTVARGALQ